MRRVLLVLAVGASALVWAPAVDASCPPRAPLRELIDDADAAIVGTLIEAKVPDEAAADELGPRLRWTVEVERDLKDNVGNTVTFHAGHQGSFVSNQFGGTEGERLGLLLHKDGGAWRVSSCDRVDPAELQAASAPPPPARGRGLPRLLAAGAFGAPRVAVLDERGDVTHYGNGTGDARVAVCPGERFYAEAVWDESREGSAATVEVRDARTMRVTRTLQLPRSIRSEAWKRPRSISCRATNARDILVSAEAGIYSARVVRWQGAGWESVYHGKARAVAFTPNGFAMVKYATSKPELHIYDAGGAIEERVRGLPSFKHLAISEPTPLVSSLDGSRIAGINEEPRDDVEMFVADLGTGDVARASARYGSEIAWDGEALIVTGDERVRVYDASLDLQEEWRGWTGSRTVVIGDRIFGVREERGRQVFVSAPYLSGPEKEERDLGDVAIDQLVVLSGERDLADRRRASPTWALYGVGLAIVILGAIVWRSRRASREEG